MFVYCFVVVVVVRRPKQHMCDLRFSKIKPYSHFNIQLNEKKNLEREKEKTLISSNPILLDLKLICVHVFNMCLSHSSIVFNFTT